MEFGEHRHPQPREPDEREQNAQNGDDSRPARRKPPAPLRRQERQRHHGQRPAPAGPAAEPQVVPTIAQTSATSFTGTATYKTPAFLKWRPASPLPTRAPTNPHTVVNATMNSTQPGSVK